MNVALHLFGFGQVCESFFHMVQDRLANNSQIRFQTVFRSRSWSRGSCLEKKNPEFAKDRPDPVEWIESLNQRELHIFIDATAETGMLDLIQRALELNHVVISANKKPLCEPYEKVTKLYDSILKQRMRIESTVGAGLPVLHQLLTLHELGEKIHSIQGVVSGTLAYLCSGLNQGNDFSSLVKTAHKLGYTEPDPREDLGGDDVLRKGLILSRLLGWSREKSDVEFEPFFSCEQGVSVHEFMDSLNGRSIGLDLPICYGLNLSKEGCKVGFFSPEQSSFLRGSGENNRVLFFTDIYKPYLLLEGPGAGREITALGLFHDMLSAIQSMGKERN